MEYYTPRFLFLAILLSVCTSCELDEGNRRGYVISKSHEVPSEEGIEWVQP
ncbi:MAG: hypothetical protein IT584_03555 [Chlamydiae bacterium]|nr:hypothetical protein [Chlamydiota bacterium]